MRGDAVLPKTPPLKTKASKRAKPKKLSISMAGAVRTSKPGFVEPCLAALVAAPPQGNDWIHEIKFDGYRVQAHVDKDSVRLLTRKGLDWTSRFGSLPQSIKSLAIGTAILDGEVVVEDAQGHSNFSALAEALKSGRARGFIYQCFDLLFLDGLDLRGVPLIDRKMRLENLLKLHSASSPIRFSSHLASDGAVMLAEACRLGLEGLISKRADRPYHSGRHDDWLKSKCIKTDEFVIGGYLTSNVSKTAIGALAVGYYVRNVFMYAGRVGTGFSKKTAADLFRQLQPLKTEECPFDTALTGLQRRNAVWVRPKLVAQIEYRSWTSDKVLRHAAFKALREDKPSRDVRRPR